MDSDCLPITLRYADGVLKNFVAGISVLIALPLTSTAQSTNQEGVVAPTVKPGSITCEECPYPYPSSYLPITLYGQELRIAYMDVAPDGQSNGHTVVLLHGNNF